MTHQTPWREARSRSKRKPRMTRRQWNIAAVWLSLAALALASAALTATLTRPQPRSWPLVCSEVFHGQYGPQNVYYPCAATRRP